jgi:hypothetical protein
MTWEYRGDGLYLCWSNHFHDHEKQDLAMFMWPTHAPEDTAKVEQLYEAIAEFIVGAQERIARLEAEKKQIARDALHEALANETLVDENRQLREQVAQTTKELAFRDFVQAQQSNIAMLNGTYEELRMALSSEIALHAAWTKRANEAEATVARLGPPVSDAEWRKIGYWKRRGQNVEHWAKREGMDALIKARKEKP